MVPRNPTMQIPVTEAISHQSSLSDERLMQEKPTVALALLAAWVFWFLFFLYLGM